MSSVSHTTVSVLLTLPLFSVKHYKNTVHLNLQIQGVLLSLKTLELNKASGKDSEETRSELVSHHEFV